MEITKVVSFAFVLFFKVYTCDSAKINSPRVLLPWLENLNVNFTFEIYEGGCYTWSLTRPDIVDLKPVYESRDSHCSRAAVVSVSKSCVPPGSVIIVAQEVYTGETLRGDVDVNIISSLKVVSTTWTLHLEEAPEAFMVDAYDNQGNKFSTLEGISFSWSIENLGSNFGEDQLVNLIPWGSTAYEAPPGILDLEVQGLQSYSVLLYGKTMGECRVTVCLGHICTDFKLRVITSVILLPATAIIAHGDCLRYRVSKSRAGRLITQDIADTQYYVNIRDTNIAMLEDTSLVRGTYLGTTNVYLQSGMNEVATATLTVAEPHSIRVNLRPNSLLIRDEMFIVHCILYTSEHAMTAGDDILIRLMVDGEADIDLLRSTENGTLTDAVARNVGQFTITARLHSIAGKELSRKVESQISAVVVDPLKVVPQELYVAWTDSIQEVQLRHTGGGNEPVVWSQGTSVLDSISLSPSGVVTIRGEGIIDVKVQLEEYSHIQASGRVMSASPELLQVSSTGYARVGRAHHLHVALTATDPATGDLYNFHSCNCASFTVSLLEGPELLNVTSAPWIPPVEGACCVVECVFGSAGVASVRVRSVRASDTARITVRAAPALLWPTHAAALIGASLPYYSGRYFAFLPGMDWPLQRLTATKNVLFYFPEEYLKKKSEDSEEEIEKEVIAQGEALVSHSNEPRVAELSIRNGQPPHRHPDASLFTLNCHKRGDAQLELTSHMDNELESIDLEVFCAPHVTRIRLDPPETPGNCSGGSRVWLRPGHEVSVKVTLFNAAGMELLDERGPKVSWDIEPRHIGIEYRSTDRLFVETNPEYTPVPVPHKYYQLVTANEKAVGWSGSLKASIPDATTSIQAIVVAPLKCDPMKINMAWEGETVSEIGSVSGGSGRYSVQAPVGVDAQVVGGLVSARLPGPGSYDLLISDQCLHAENLLMEVNIEEILSVEVSTSRAVCVDACVPISALVKGAVSHRYLSTSGSAEWRTLGNVYIRNNTLCGLKEGVGRVRAALGGVWSPEVEVWVFPPLEAVPSRSRVPVGGRVVVGHRGGPPAHVARLVYTPILSQNVFEVSSSGSVHGLSTGTGRIKLVALDVANMEMASAEAEIEVIPISNIRIRAATQILLVGKPAPLWVEAEGLSAASLASLVPQPRVTFTLRDPTTARLYTTHVDDLLERSVAEGLSVRVVPLKPGIITVDVRVRNMGQVAEIRSWDSTVEILSVNDIRTSIEGSKDLSSGDRLALAVGAVVRIKSLPRSNWKAYGEGAFEVTPSGELRALSPGHGVVIAYHKDDRNNIYREIAIHVEVSRPEYCTAEPSGDFEEDRVRLVMRNSVGRELIAPDANITVSPPHVAHNRRPAHSALGSELIIVGLDATGSFVSFQGTSSGVTVTDHVWVMGSDSTTHKIIATGGWAVCLEGAEWRVPPDVVAAVGGTAGGSVVTLAVLTHVTAGTHLLRRDRPPATSLIHQLPLEKMEFVPGEWPSALVPLSFEASGLSGGPLLCTEEQRYALEGIALQLPYTCRTKAPHTAEPVFDIINGVAGCKIIPGTKITDASEVEVCAEWEVLRSCTKVYLLPAVRVSRSTVSLANPPAGFTIEGHPHALRLVKITSSPGLKMETTTKEGVMTVGITNEASTCGLGWVDVKSKLTAQEFRVDVERGCDAAYGTLLGAILSLLLPYTSTMVTIGAAILAYIYLQSKLQRKAVIKPPTEPPQTVLPTPPGLGTPPGRTRTWSRSPYATPAPRAPVYGDPSVLPDNSFSSNNTSANQSLFL